MSNNGHSEQPSAVKYRSGEIPVISCAEERAAAQKRQAAFPLRFPHDGRQLGGKFTVEENSRRLLRYFYIERRLAQALGAWTLAIPELEVKIETGRHIFYHADAARTLRERLSEQEMLFRVIDAHRDAEVDRFIEEMLSAETPAELLVGVHQVLGRAMQNAYRHHIDDTCPVSDAPSIRVLKRLLVDYEPMLDWADAAIRAYVEGSAADETRLATWRWHLKRLLAGIGGVSGADAKADEPSPLRSKNKPFVRNTVPKRDARFQTSSASGDYDIIDGRARFPAKTYEAIRLHFMRTQRDEVDAIEAFGTFLWDIRFLDFDAEYHLARITWDEARHTETGHRALLAAGYNPFELANRLLPSTCRGPMEPAYAMAEINLFGEVGVLKTIGGLVGEAQERNDALLLHIADFIRADERTHVRKGRHVLGVMTDLGMQELETKTRELFTECLVSLGAVNPEFNPEMLTREEMERLVGE